MSTAMESVSWNLENNNYDVIGVKGEITAKAIETAFFLLCLLVGRETTNHYCLGQEERMNQKLLKIQPADFFGPNHNIHSKVN